MQESRTRNHALGRQKGCGTGTGRHGERALTRLCTIYWHWSCRSVRTLAGILKRLTRKGTKPNDDDR
jgi:hypothetical protein